MFCLKYVPGTYVCLNYVPVCTSKYIFFELFTSMYWYVLSAYQWSFYFIWYLSLISEGYIRVHTEPVWVHTWSSWITFRAQQVCMPAIHEPAHALIQITLEPAHALIQITLKHQQVDSLLLCSTCACTPWLRGRGLAGDSAAADQLRPTLRHHDQRPANQQHQQQPAT